MLPRVCLHHDVLYVMYNPTHLRASILHNTVPACVLRDGLSPSLATVRLP